MNSANMRACFQIAPVARRPLRSRTSCWCKALAFLLGFALARPALPMVGPAQEAPEFAPFAVMVMTRSGSGADFCTAGVIARNVVLTAAHCVTDISDTKVFFRASENKLVVFDVAAIAAHPRWKPNSGRKRISVDLALVRLTEPLPSRFKPLELARLDHVSIGERFRMIGFGRASEDVSGTSGVLRAGILAVGALEAPPVFVKLVDPNGTGLGGCTGDSGGPILSTDQLALAAVAIQAKGYGGRSCGAATRAVLIGPLLPWIRETLRSWNASWSMTQQRP